MRTDGPARRVFAVGGKQLLRLIDPSGRHRYLGVRGVNPAPQSALVHLSYRWRHLSVPTALKSQTPVRQSALVLVWKDK